MAAIFGYALYREGGVLTRHWNGCLAALGLLAIAYWVLTPRFELAPPLERGLWWPVALWPLYALFQLVPLPYVLLRFLSPARAELVDVLAPVLGAVHYAPLSVVPSATASHFLRIAGYTIVFLLVREIAWRAVDRTWEAAAPIILLAALEAGLGALQYAMSGPNGFARGTYLDRDHFAGLLEMALPFAVMYPIAILQRRGFERDPSLRPVLAACGVIALAALLFLGIVYSLSRMGFVAALVSLFVMGSLTLGGSLRGRQRWLAIGVVAAGILLTFVFLPPAQLVQRFAQVSSTEQMSAEGRLQLWEETLQLVSAYRVFGCGLGGYESAFLRYKVSAPLVTDNFAHNDYLQVLAEGGVIGFAIVAALFLGIVARAIRATSYSSEANARYLGVACTGALAAILVHSAVDFNLNIPANALLLAWVSGIVSSLTASAPLPAKKALRIASAPRE